MTGVPIHTAKEPLAMSHLLTTSASYPNALMLLITEDDPTVPDIDGVADIWQSESMLVLAVQHDAEGDVELQITNETPSAANMTLLFDGILPTVRRLVEIQTVYLDRITGIRTLTEELPLRIWGGDPRQPEHVVIECLGLVELS